MSEYIRAVVAAKAIADKYGIPLGDLVDTFADIPAADVAPVVHGQWKRIRSNWYCTRCRTGYRITYGAVSAKTFTFCPNCGAKMAEKAVKEEA